MDMRTQLIRSKHKIGLVLFIVVLSFVISGVGIQGYFVARRSIDAKIQSLDEFATVVAHELGVQGQQARMSMTTDPDIEFERWMKRLQGLSIQLDEQLKDSSTMNEAWFPAEEGADPEDGLIVVTKKIRGLADVLDQHLKEGQPYFESAYFNEMLQSLLYQEIKDNKKPSEVLRSSFVQNLSHINDINFFIVRENDSFVFPRRSTALKSDAVWDKYSGQLLNQMKLNDEGWVFFPPKASWQLDQSQYILRYFTLEEEATVAVETYVDSELSYMMATFTPKFWVLLFGLIVILFVIINVMSYFLIRHFDRILCEFAGGSYLKGYKKKKEVSVNNIHQADDEIKDIVIEKTETYKDNAIMRDKYASIKKKRFTDNDEVAVPEREVLSVNNEKSTLVKKKSLSIEPKGSTVITSRIATDSMLSEVHINADKAKEAFCNDLSFAVKGIRSPALKKVLGQIRTEKKDNTR